MKAIASSRYIDCRRDTGAPYPNTERRRLAARLLDIALAAAISAAVGAIVLFLAALS